jgi:hypothetical protein
LERHLRLHERLALSGIGKQGSLGQRARFEFLLCHSLVGAPVEDGTPSMAAIGRRDRTSLYGSRSAICSARVFPGEMFQVFGTRLFLSEVGVLRHDKKHIKDECVAYINDLRTMKKILNKHVEDTGFGNFGDWGGYTFACGETNEFKSIVNHYKTVVDEVAEDNLPSVAENLLELLGEDPNKFIRMISRNIHEEGHYLDVAVLKYVPTSEFADAIMKLKAEDMSQVFLGLSIRYDAIATNSGLISELPWLKELLSILQDKQEKLPIVSRFRIKNYCNRYLVPHVQAASTKSAGESDKG